MKIPPSNRLHLCPLAVADEAFVYSLYTNEQVLASYETAPISSKEETVPFIQHITQPGCFVWVITLHSDPQPIGLCALHHWDKKEHTIEIGGTLMPHYWGKGIMVEAFQLLQDYAYKTLGVTTIIAKTQSNNQQAIRMAAKLGFSAINNNGSETTLVHRATTS